jgi:hypothetical protein
MTNLGNSAEEGGLEMGRVRTKIERDSLAQALLRLATIARSGRKNLMSYYRGRAGMHITVDYESTTYDN